MAEHKMTLEDWLDDLCVRFIINLPKEDLSTVSRICFQVEEAQWFYEDFIRPLDPTLPSMSLRSFCLRIFQHCPLLASFSVENHMRAFEEFLQYKTRVPVRGAILLNEAMDSTVLVKGWKKGANWSFPRGKINKDEDHLDCAIREVYEETGFDIRAAGLVPKDDEVKYIQISMREQQIRLYVFRNVPMDTVFQPKTRKEISKIQWYKLSELPAFRKKSNNYDDAAAASNANKFYMVAPFLVPLKKWVVQQKKKDAARAAAANNSQPAIQPEIPVEEPLTEDDIGAQTEPVAAPSNDTPAIETLEGATLELQRLLKVQPPTQGVQMTPSAALHPDKGEALMAILQKKATLTPSEQAHQPDTRLPHTPFDHTYSSAPEPQSPHHHHSTHRLPDPNPQPPPTFTLPTSTAHSVSPRYFNQTRVPAQVQPQVYGPNPFMNAAQQPRKEPVLVHPQPLPPQVQQSRLTRGILSTPAVPETAGQAGQGGPQTQQGGANTFTGNRYDAYAPQQQSAKSVPLTGHAMALLNTFKNNANNESKPTSQPSQDGAALQANNQHQQHHIPWTNLPATQSSNPAAQFLPHHMAPVAQPRTSPRAMQHPEVSNTIPRHTQLPDSHRSALLDMFKRSGPRSPLSNEITMKPRNAQDGPGFARSAQPGSPGYKTSSTANAMASAPEVNGVPVQTNPETTLPYRAVQILSRPKQPEAGKVQDFTGAQTQMHHLQQRLSPLGSARHDARNSGRPSLPSPRDRSFLHQMEQDAKRSPQLNYAGQVAAQAAGLPYTQPLQHSPTSGHAVLPFHQQQPAGVLRRRQDSNPEQRQKLLSLFGREHASPTGFTADDKGKARELPFDQAQSTTPRSRVASIASVGRGENVTSSSPTSRRGSQTPISPADRNFLLSYLESVSNSAR
ncbi:mRNA-decapping enzyme subunit 2 [Madurella fahalii]|uniref:mRNA-decapping enzyme subunit 2 n=1 Tax=Madurella fahalii TaxID=1157608 RepID=A0ABQ0GST1_9PEZI